MTELRRTAILIALAVVSYMLFLSWQHDYGVLATAQQSSSAATQVSADIPSAPAKAGGNADIPVAPSAPGAAPVVAAAPISTANVQVHSDVLNFSIDPRGGDIVGLNLPQYTRSVDSKEPFTLLENNAARVYIAQSGLIGADGPDAGDSRPLYQSASPSYTLAAGQNAMDVVLSLPAKDGVQIQKVFHVQRGSYLINVSYHVVNQGSKAWSGLMFGQLKRDDSKDPSAGEGRFGMSTFLGGAWWSPEKNFNKLAFKKFTKDPLNESTQGGWAAIVQHYFVSAWVPDHSTQNTFTTRVSSDQKFYLIGFTGSPVQLAPGQQISIGAQFYAGPKVQEVLKTISPGLDLTVDYGWLWFVAKLLFWLLTHIHAYVVNNWGWSIILLTVLVKAAFFPLSARSYKSMANMRKIMPQMQRLKEQFGDDRAKLGQATMDLYRKEGVNPLGGCLPLLLQMPVFLALYWTLMESVELRHATWFWLNDLSVMDPLFILPILNGITMLVQQSLNPPPQDPTQARVMKLMPIMFTFMFLWFPAGLVLYWVVNNSLSIVQQWVINRTIAKA